MLTPWAQTFKELIGRNFPSRRAFARAAHPAENENLMQGWLAKTLNGKINPPMQFVEIWGRTLGLKGYELEAFCFQAGLAHFPEDMAKRLWAAYRRQRMLIDYMRRELADDPTAAELFKKLDATVMDHGAEGDTSGYGPLK